MTRQRGLALAVAVALAAGACSDNSDPVLQSIEEVNFAPSLGIDLAAMTKLPEGVYIQDMPVGMGPELMALDSAFLPYSAWFSTGTLFDGGNLRFRYLSTSLIQGFNVGLEGLQLGGTRRMIIPWELAYGPNDLRDNRGNVVIPGGSVLIFQVSLDSIF